MENTLEIQGLVKVFIAEIRSLKSELKDIKSLMKLNQKEWLRAHEVCEMLGFECDKKDATRYLKGLEGAIKCTIGTNPKMYLRTDVEEVMRAVRSNKKRVIRKAGITYLLKV